MMTSEKKINENKLNNDKKILKIFEDECLHPCTSWRKLHQLIISFFPIINWIPKYNIEEDISNDIIGGLLSGFLHIPQGMTFGLLAGLQPINGIYLSFLSSFFYMFMGTSRHISMGSHAITSLTTGLTSDEILLNYYSLENSTFIAEHPSINPSTIAATLSFLVGLFQIIFVVFKLEFLTTYFNDALIGGFTTGALFHLISSQIDDMLGIPMKKFYGPGYLFPLWYTVFERINLTNFFCFSVSMICCVILIFDKDFISPLINRLTKKNIVIPIEILMLTTAAIISKIYNFNENYDLQLIGELPRGFPSIQPPKLELIPQCLSSALFLFIVGIALQTSFSRTISKKFDYKIDKKQEIYALGFTSVLCGMFPVYTPYVAPDNTALHVESGVKTQLSAVFTCSFLFLFIMYLGPFYESLPACVLSTVMVVNAMRAAIMKFLTLPSLYSISKIDFIIWMIGFIMTVSLNVVYGFFITIIVSMATVNMRIQWPKWGSKVIPVYSDNNESFKNISVFNFESYLLFNNVDTFIDAVKKTINDYNNDEHEYKSKEISYFIFDCSSIILIDTMGINAIKEVVTFIKKNTSFKVYYCSCKPEVKKLLLKSSVVTNGHEFFDTVNDCILFIKRQMIMNEVTNNECFAV